MTGGKRVLGTENWTVMYLVIAPDVFMPLLLVAEYPSSPTDLSLASAMRADVV